MNNAERDFKVRLRGIKLANGEEIAGACVFHEGPAWTMEDIYRLRFNELLYVVYPSRVIYTDDRSKISFEPWSLIYDCVNTAIPYSQILHQQDMSDVGFQMYKQWIDRISPEIECSDKIRNQVSKLFSLTSIENKKDVVILSESDKKDKMLNTLSHYKPNIKH